MIVGVRRCPIKCEHTSKQARSGAMKKQICPVGICKRRRRHTSELNCLVWIRYARSRERRPPSKPATPQPSMPPTCVCSSGPLRNESMACEGRDLLPCPRRPNPATTGHRHEALSAPAPPRLLAKPRRLAAIHASLPYEASPLGYPRPSNLCLLNVGSSGKAA